MHTTQKVLVVGATGGSGRATLDALLRSGHRGTAFARHADELADLSDRLDTFNGDATNPDDVEHAVRGHDAVIITFDEDFADIPFAGPGFEEFVSNENDELCTDG